MSVVSELSRLLKVKAAKEEPAHAFSVRLAKKANGISDDAWEGLDGATQDWVNDALRAIQAKRPVPYPPGIEDVYPGVKPTSESPPAPSSKKVQEVPVEEASPQGEFKMRSSARMAKTGVIRLLVGANPHRPTALDYAQFAVLKDGMTVEQAVAAGAARSYVRYILNKGYISVGQ